jgi:hypothetical protein
MDWSDEDKQVFRKARELSLRISQSLPRTVDPASISLRAKIPFKAVCVREVLIHRVSELGEVACDLIESGRIVAAIILVRALMESVALLYWLNKKLHAVVEAKATGDINDFLDRAMVGTRNAGTPLKAINVLSAIDEVTKEFNEFRLMYDDLSEFLSLPIPTGAVH